jgi:hypothetical protein
MQWQKKLYQHEETPPEEIWERLQQEIADDPIKLRSALLNFESAPPADTWQNVAREINAEEIAPVIDIRARNYNRIYSYAAIFAGAVLIIAALLYAYVNNGEGLNTKEFSTSIFSTDSQAKIKNAEINNLPPVSYTDGNYIHVLDGSGAYKNVSYKFYDMVQVMYANDSESATAKGKQYWQNTITAWNEKIVKSSFVPAAGNFFDLAEMISMLEENK